MPQEINRKTSVRRITNPDDKDTYVDVIVIDEISFIDPKDQYQQTTFTIDNSNEASREVHTVTVKGSAEYSDDGVSRVDVERIDTFSVIDPKDNYQETVYTLDNSSEDRFAVDYAPSGNDQRKTHDVKVYSKDKGAWLEIRRTDSFFVTDPKDHYQETEWTLDNKDEDVSGENDPPPDLDPPTTTWDGTSINPPWRLDPYQNIVDVSWGKCLIVFYNGNSVAAVPMGKLPGITSKDVIYAKTLSASNWNDAYNSATRMVACQLKLSDAFSPILAPFTMTAGAPDPVTGKISYTLALNPKWQCYNVAKGHKLSDGSAASSISNWSDPNQFSDFDGAYVVPVDPVMNGVGSLVYFNGDAFTTASSGAPTVTPNSSLFCTWYSGDGTPSIQTPDFVTRDGQYYFGLQVNNNGLTIKSRNGGAWSDAINTAKTSWSSTNIVATPPTVDRTQPTWSQTIVTTTVAGYSVTVGPSDAVNLKTTSWKVTFTDTYDSSTGEVTSSADTVIDGSMDLGSCPLLVFSQVNGYDRLDLANFGFSGTYADGSSSGSTNVGLPNPDIQFNWTDSYSRDYDLLGIADASSGDVSGSKLWTGSGPKPPAHVPGYALPAAAVEIDYFPFATGTGAAGAGVWMGQATGAGASHNWSAFGAVPDPTGSTGWKGWLHVSNGKHVIQAASYEGHSYLYLDGVNWGATLAAAIGVSLEEIDCVLMDISLGDIKQLI